MRFLIISVAVLTTATTAAAQSRWTLSTGPEWSRGIPALRTWGARFRAEYDLTPPSSVFGLRLEGGARWNPTQSYLFSDGIGTLSGTDQQFDLMLGFNASLAPIPGPLSPYASFGTLARQQWTQGSRTLSVDEPMTRSMRWYPHLDIVGSLGVGLRGRLFSRSFQVEYRRLYDHNGLTFGTRLPF
jgi:hypothetical protein